MPNEAPNQTTSLSRVALRYATIGLIALVGLSGCITETVSSQCKRLAEKQCESCFSCAQDDDLVSGAEICGVKDQSSESECRDKLEDQCINQARLDRNPYDKLDKCEGAIDNDACSKRLSRYALDHPRAPEACTSYF